MDSILIYHVVIDSLLINILLQVHVLIFSVFVIFGSFLMFLGKNLLILLLVFRNCYLKEVAQILILGVGKSLFKIPT